MSIINRELVKAINSGKCIVVVGSGPSIEMGLTSWNQLAEQLITKLSLDEHKSDIQKCRYLLRDHKYPEIFSVCEKLLGKDIIKDVLVREYRTNRVNGKSYGFIANWPFALYLTTNYDDCMYNHVRALGVPILQKLNSHADFASLNAIEKDIVFKIHGDYNDYDNIVLTHEQYSEFISSPQRKYWREKICAALHMLPVLIIGYSVSDPDFLEQLERAKEIAIRASVFMIAADMGQELARDLNLNNGIKVITYRNQGENHSELIKLLKRYDSFIARRKSPNIGKQEIPFDEVETASSILIFTRIASTNSTTDCQLKSFMGLIIDELYKLPEGESISEQELLDCATKRLFTSTIDIESFSLAIDKLTEYGYVRTVDNAVTLLAAGKEIYGRAYSGKHNKESRFKIVCRDYLKKYCTSISDEEITSITDKLIAGLVISFRRRGIEIVRSLIGQGTMDFSSSTDMIEVINGQFSDLSSNETKAAAADLLIDVILSPTEAVKEYLVMLSQGFFAYHALGLDKKSLLFRKELAKNSSWIIDSSILIPLVAKDCDSHEFAIDLLNRMKSCELNLISTDHIIQEVVHHAMWMINNYINCSYSSAELLAIIVDSPGHKPNLFINGYVNWSITQSSPSVRKYIEYCLPDTFGKHYEDRIRNILLSEFIQLLDYGKLTGDGQEYFAEIGTQTETIRRKREERGTIRGADGGDHQCTTEAEVVIVCKKENYSFLTSSTFLDANLPQDKKFSWNPDTMYKFLTTISSDLPDVDLLYQSMIQEYYYSGFDVMDQSSVKEYFKEPIRQASLEIEDVKNEYSSEIRNPLIRNAIDRFDTLDDLSKPFYARQISEYIIRNRSKVLVDKEKGIDEKLKTLELTEKERKEYKTLKAKESNRKTTHKKNKQKKANKGKRRNRKGKR